MRTRSTTTAVAAVLATAGVAAGGFATTLGAGTADAKTYHRHEIALTSSQTALVAHNNVGYAFAGVPSIPNLIYNPGFGVIIQREAARAAAQGGCITIGIGTPTNGRGSNIDYVERRPASHCAR